MAIISLPHFFFRVPLRVWANVLLVLIRFVSMQSCRVMRMLFEQDGLVCTHTKRLLILFNKVRERVLLNIMIMDSWEEGLTVKDSKVTS
jgi:hypothetical protein